MRVIFHLVALIGCTLCMAVASNPVDTSILSGDTTRRYREAILYPVVYNKTVGIEDMQEVIHQSEPARIQMGYSKQGRMIHAWYFPGVSEHRALVIGGVHGSELSSIEVANELIRQLAKSKALPYYSVVVIPSLFPDNAALAANFPGEAGSEKNIGRYSYNTAIDPNRQMPSPGRSFNEILPTDHLDRTIELENQLLLQLIQSFKPQRIANLHAIRNTGYGGIYADPRTDHLGFALGFASDSNLAVDMAKYVAGKGGNVAGNRLNTTPTALYYKDPRPAAPGQFQQRNMSGSALHAHRGSGVSMGTWGTTAVAGQAMSRPAMRVLTIEFPGAKRPQDYATASQRKFFSNQVSWFAEAILSIFLEEHYPEIIPDMGL